MCAIDKCIISRKSYDWILSKREVSYFALPRVARWQCRRTGRLALEARPECRRLRRIRSPAFSYVTVPRVCVCSSSPRHSSCRSSLQPSSEVKELRLSAERRPRGIRVPDRARTDRENGLTRSGGRENQRKTVNGNAEVRSPRARGAPVLMCVCPCACAIVHTKKRDRRWRIEKE